MCTDILINHFIPKLNIISKVGYSLDNDLIVYFFYHHHAAVGLLTVDLESNV